MEKQTIIFTALPNGRTADALRLSVFISPRLWSDDPNVANMKLSQFEDWLDWTSRIGAATWKVAFDGGPTLDATVESAAPSPELWSALFKADTDVIPFRFDDYRGAVIETFPSDLIYDLLVGVYTRVGSEPSLGGGRDLPPIEELAKDPDIIDIAREVKLQDIPKPGPRPGPLDMGGTVPKPEPEPETPPTTGCCICGCLLAPFLLLATPFPKLKARLKKLCTAPPPPDQPVFSTEPKPVPDPPAPPPPDPPVPPGPVPKPVTPPSANRAAFNDLNNFLTPMSEVPQALPTAAELKQKYDFHQMVSALGDYPLLLRQFGIVVDLLVPLDGAAPAAESMLNVEPTLALIDDSTIVTPRTHYQLAADSFAAQPRPVDPEISNGLLRFNDNSLFRVIQVDVVGGGKKFQGAATTIEAYGPPANRAPNMPDNSGLPALRSGGISVIRRNLAPELRSRFRRSHALQQAVFNVDKAPQPPEPPAADPPLPATDELFAEDLVAGYRVDVFDAKSNRWHSLCQRVGTYDFLDAPAAPGGTINLAGLEDEGFVQFAAAEPLTAPANKTIRTSDALFVWEGWSLCAPRPGQSIMPQEPLDPPEKVTLDKPKNEAVTNFKLEANFKAKDGSLPRLRFDHKYRLRARVCDLAGNSVFGPGDPAFLNDVAEQTDEFPCARYEPVAPPAMMLREEPVEGESLEHLVVRSPPVDGETQTTERHIVPPKISQLVAEQHGKFDLASQKMDNSASGYNLAGREAGALTDGATEIKPDIWVQAADQFTVSYLPDPSSRGVLLLGLPGMADDDEIIGPAPRVNKIPFDNPWPDPLPFRLRLVAIGADTIPAQPKWIDAPGEPRVLVVELAESDRKTVRLSSYLAPEDMERQGVLQWARAEAPAGLAAIEADLEAGRSWQHLPWRDITLVHAVQKPLKPPTAAVDTPAGKKLGETFATISGKLTTHVASTGKVDLRGQWADPIDDLTKPEPGTEDHQAHLCEVLVDADDVDTDILESAKHTEPIHNFGDTKFHSVAYVPIAATRFREYFPNSVTDIPANITVEGPPSNAVMIRNSARPEAPKVLYVIPFYEWQDDPPVPGKVTRKRRGGLRVYLDRPWYSSGDGELLGVVYAENLVFTDLNQRLKRLLTQWGTDPIWLTSASTTFAKKANFTGTADTGGNLSLAEVSQPVSVAGYKPEFDKKRRLWFADIEINPGENDMPFVRLALARFQPNSVADAHLSRVVRADFAQLAPERSASVTTTTTPASANFKVLVKGLTYQGSSATSGAGFLGDKSSFTGLAQVEAFLQKRNPDVSDPDLGWNTAASIVLDPDPVELGEWTGELNILEALVPDTWRILLKEYEWYRADLNAEDENLEQMSFAKRIVYAVAIELG